MNMPADGDRLAGGQNLWLSPPIDLTIAPRIVRIGRARVPAGGTRRYTVDEYWGLHVYFGEGQFSVCGREFILAPGSVTVTPRGETSEYRSDAELDHVFVHVAIREDPVHGHRLPLHAERESGAAHLESVIQRALILARESESWAEALIWEALHEAAAMARTAQIQGEARGVDQRAEASGRTRTEMPPRESGSTAGESLRRALDYVELHLPTRILLPALAKEAGVSATHLNRLFAANLGTSAMNYVRERRMDLARYLLTSTSIPVKEIAYQIGVPDVHAFNKLCKRYLGAPPTTVRASAPG